VSLQQAVEAQAGVPNPLLEALIRQKQDVGLAIWVEDQFRSMKSVRQDQERQWYLNLAFYFGNHYIKPLGSFKDLSFTTPKAPPWRVRLVVNRIRPAIRTEIAKLTAQKPTVYVIPATGEDEDKAAAKAAGQVWEAAYRDKEFKKILRRALWWGTICGNVYIKEYWDSGIGPKMQNPLTGEEQAMGDVALEVVSPFHLFVPDVTLEDIEQQPYVIHTTLKDVSYIQRVYGFAATANSSSNDALIDNRYLNIINEATVNRKDQVMVHEVWIKPNGHRAFPAGGLLTVINSKVVQRIDKYPYPHGEFPFAKFDHVQTGKFYSDSVITDLIPLQRALNLTRSQITEAKNMTAKPQLLAAKGSVQPRKITSEPGQVIEYTPGLPAPTPLPLQPLPNYVLDEIDRLKQEMDEIAGTTEMSRGNNPSQVTAYSALSYLQDQSETKLAASVASVEEFVEKIARLYLKYVVSYWDMPRTIKTVGKDKMIEVSAWKGGDLQGNTDIRVEAGSAIPLGKQQRQAFLLDLFKLGVFPPESLLDLLEMRDIEDAQSEFLVDKQQAQRENIMLMNIGAQVPPEMMQPVMDPVTGQQLPPQIPQIFMPHSYDNHEAHIQYHNNFRKSQEFEQSPDVVRQLFEQHVTLHQQALMGVMPANGGPPIGGPEQQPTAVGVGESSAPGGNTSTPSSTQPPQQGN
jgi:hypothetical protein